MLGGGTSQADVRGHTVSAEAALLGPVEGVTLEPIGRERARHDRRASERDDQTISFSALERSNAGCRFILKKVRGKWSFSEDRKSCFSEDRKGPKDTKGSFAQVFSLSNVS